MSTLRKACTNCTASKRKCVVQKPKCTRCSVKRLNCVYELEPVQAPPTGSDEAHAFGFNLKDDDTLGVCIMRHLEVHSLELDLGIVDPGHDNCLEITRLGFGRVPDLVRAKKPAFFVHPKLQLHGVYNHFATLVEYEAKGVRCESFKQLILLDIQSVPLKEVLTALQALLVHLAASIFSAEQLEQDQAEDSLRIFLSPWTQALLACVDAGLTKGSSAWQNWLLGESVRRTIFMAYALNLAVFGYKYGQCSDWLFMESLPFDSRPGLWMADSPQKWIAAAHVECGEDVGEQLVSYHAFAEAVRGQSTGLFGDEFLTLLAYAHNGIHGGN